MPQITLKLLRKRAEHNEGLLSSLEEISLHQEELENINEVLGMTCKHLKIIYLQNNIIFKMENLVHLKELEYLNLALNNISVIEGLHNCEFLKKLDLTVNFIDVDTLEASIDHLVSRDRLRELYLMGNPCQASWPDYESYVIAKLPQLQSIDGKEITRSMQIVARQKLPQLEARLRQLAAAKREEKRLNTPAAEVVSPAADSKGASREVDVVAEDVDSSADVNAAEEDEASKLTENTPEVRVEIYKELAQQKKEKEDREKANQPKERDYDKEHKESLTIIRAKELETPEGEIKQRNEAGWEFLWDEDHSKGVISLEVKLPKFLDNSLIDVDVHPNYISIVVKGKLLRLRLPEEIKVSESKCQRSKVSGSLVVLMPKANAKSGTVFLSAADPRRGQQRSSGSNNSNAANNRVTRTGPKKQSLQEMMLAEALRESATISASDTAPAAERLEFTESKGLDYRNIVKQREI